LADEADDRRDDDEGVSRRREGERRRFLLERFVFAERVECDERAEVLEVAEDVRRNADEEDDRPPDLLLFLLRMRWTTLCSYRVCPQNLHLPVLRFVCRRRSIYLRVLLLEERFVDGCAHVNDAPSRARIKLNLINAQSIPRVHPQIQQVTATYPSTHTLRSAQRFHKPAWLQQTLTASCSPRCKHTEPKVCPQRGCSRCSTIADTC
jgi:hypothetical protein